MSNRHRAKLRPDGTCPRCEQIHDPRKCAAHTTHGNQPCGRWHIKGGQVCVVHGGATTIAKRKADQVKAETKAKAELAKAAVTLGLALDISPTDALLGEVAMTAGHVAWLRARVRELAPEDLTWGTTEHKSKTGGEDWGETTVEQAKPSIWYELYSRERDRLIKVCAEAIRAGVEERRVQLAEQQGQLVAECIRRILNDLGLSPEQEAQVAEVVPRHLRSLGGGTP